MVLEPIAAKDVKDDDHGQTDEHGVGDAYKAIAGQTIAAEDKTADNGLQQIVRQTHTSEETKVAEGVSNGFKGIPCRNHRRGDHQEYEEIVDRREPRSQIAKTCYAQHNNHQCRHTEDNMPYP